MTLHPCRTTSILIFGSLLMGLLLVETIPRVSPKLRPLPRTYVGEYANRSGGMFIADPAIGWKMQPNTQQQVVTEDFRILYRANAQGFRSAHDFDAVQPLARVAVVGDSFSFGVGVAYEQTFSVVLDEKLQQAIVYNFAIPGFALDQMWLSARHYALLYKPSLLIVCLIRKSFDRSQEAYRLPEGWNKPTFHLVHGALVQKTAADRPGALIRFLQHYSVIWRLSRLGSRTIAQHLPYSEWWHLNIAILQQIRADANMQRMPVLFVLIPTYYEPRFPALNAYMKQQGLRFIDLSEAQGFDRQTMYYPHDGHLNAAGHQWIAEKLYAWIRSNVSFLVQ